MKRLLFPVARPAGTLLIAAILSGCMPPAPAPAPVPAIPPVSAITPTEVDPARIESDATIAVSLAGTPGLATLASEARVAGLVPLLEQDGPYTLFAPSDAAFTRLAPGIAGALLAPANRQTLLAVLRYHLVAGRLTTQDLAARIRAGQGSATLVTLTGQPLVATMTGDVITLTSRSGNRSYIEAGDIPQANGVIHVVNGVLIPAVP